MHHMSHDELLARFLSLSQYVTEDMEGMNAVNSHLASAGPMTSQAVCQRTIAAMLDFIHSTQPEDKKHKSHD